MSEKANFEGWAIVELFGHNQIAGHVSEQAIGGTSFVRVDVPGVDGTGFTKFFGGSAIYAITPTTEAIATAAAGRLAVRPVREWIVPVPDGSRQLPPEVYDVEEIESDEIEF